MSKSNKELAVDIMCAWLKAYGQMCQNQHVTSARMPSSKDVITEIKFLTEELSKIE